MKESMYGRGRGGVGVTGVPPAAQRADWSRTGERSARPLAETESDHCRQWRRFLSVALARYTTATFFSAMGHKALRGT